MGLVGNGWANCFRAHNELTMGLLGKYPLAPSDFLPAFTLGSSVVSPLLLAAVTDLDLLSEVNDRQHRKNIKTEVKTGMKRVE